jgi:hypothetical protein
MAQTWCLQGDSNRRDSLGRLGELRFRFPVPAESRQDLAQSRLPQPHFAGCLDVLSQMD